MPIHLRQSVLSALLLFACICPPVEGRDVLTREGVVSTKLSSEAGQFRTEVLLQGKLVVRLDGDATLHKLSVHAAHDYVPADAESPGLHCRHKFVLLEVGADGRPASSSPFGECMTLFGARLQDGNAVVQLAEAAAKTEGTWRIHEFAFTAGRIHELQGVLDYCEASALAANSIAAALTRDEGNKTVTGAGRAYFHSAPVDECRTPLVFLVPGDRVGVRRKVDDFVEIEYHNPQSGQVFRGWIRRDRLLGPAQ